MFDINDFDETAPGPFEWDVKRLAASFVVAGRDHDFSAKKCRNPARSVTTHYRQAMLRFAGQPILSVWYAHLDVDRTIADVQASRDKHRRRTEATLQATNARIAKARTRDSMQAIRKLTVGTGDGGSSAPAVDRAADRCRRHDGDAN